MSYRCQNCDEIHRGASNKVVTKERKVIYDHCIIKRDKRQGEDQQQSMFQTNGTEIAEELYLCNACAKYVREDGPKTLLDEKLIVHFLPKQKPTFNKLQEGNYNSFSEAFNNNERVHNDRKDKRHDREDWSNDDRS